MPTSTVFQTWYAVGQAVAVTAPLTEIAVGVFLAFIVIAAIMKAAGWELGPLPEYDDFEPQ
jgi:hypothetical protein